MGVCNIIQQIDKDLTEMGITLDSLMQRMELEFECEQTIHDLLTQKADRHLLTPADRFRNEVDPVATEQSQHPSVESSQ